MNAMISSEYACIIAALVLIVYGFLVLAGRADGQISIGGFNRTRLNARFRVKPVRLVKAASLLIAAILLAVAPHSSKEGVWVVLAIVVLVAADPLMLLFRK